MNVHCLNSQNTLKIDTAQVEHLVQTFLKWKEVNCDEISIYFVEKEEISRLHEIHFNDPTPTDCISFPMDDPQESGEDHIILGEVFVCPAVALEYAQKHQLSPYEETSLYIIHGLLHLLGYDDVNPDQIKTMRDEEKAAIDYLKQKEAMLNG